MRGDGRVENILAVLNRKVGRTYLLCPILKTYGGTNFFTEFNYKTSESEIASPIKEYSPSISSRPQTQQQPFEVGCMLSFTSLHELDPRPEQATNRGKWRRGNRYRIQKVPANESLLLCPPEWQKSGHYCQVHLIISSTHSPTRRSAFCVVLYHDERE